MCLWCHHFCNKICLMCSSLSTCELFFSLVSYRYFTATLEILNLLVNSQLHFSERWVFCNFIASYIISARAIPNHCPPCCRLLHYVIIHLFWTKVRHRVCSGIKIYSKSCAFWATVFQSWMSTKIFCKDFQYCSWMVHQNHRLLSNWRISILECPFQIGKDGGWYATQPTKHIFEMLLFLLIQLLPQDFVGIKGRAKSSTFEMWLSIN